MQITKSTRHQKIIGDFGEHLICNWLSRSGFEVSIVDHTGIDLIAYSPKFKKRIGITVKSRTRNRNTETDSVNIFNNKNDIIKFENACLYFSCEPWIGIYVERTLDGFLFLTSYDNYNRKYKNIGCKTQTWNMTSKSIQKYESDSLMNMIALTFTQNNWKLNQFNA